jgi:hypothetical protein
MSDLGRCVDLVWSLARIGHEDWRARQQIGPHVKLGKLALYLSGRHATA